MKREKEKSGRFLIIAICFLLFISTAQGAWDNDDLMYAKSTSGGQLMVHNIDTEEDFETIQDAIDDPDTKDGHNISVDAGYPKPGISPKPVVINKQLKLIGKNKENTIIDGDGSGNCIQVTADNVEIHGFTIRNGKYGVYLESSNCCVIDNNIISIDFDGIFLSNSVNNTIAHNNISEVERRGIRLSYSSNNRIHDNDLSENDEGIVLFASLDNIIYHNNFIDNRNQAKDNRDTNRWDKGFEEGGNYWSDRKCTGNPSNGSQPYNISVGGAKDTYPFMDRDGWSKTGDITIDTIPPVIYHENITNATGGESIPISATIIDNTTKVASATLFYRITGEETWASIPMIPTGNIYSATIQASQVTIRGVQYYIEAVDDASNNATSPATAPEKPYSIAVTVLNTSTVTIFTTSSTIKHSEIISGNIIPEHRANVTLTFTSPTSSNFTRTTTSAISGCYHFLFTPNPNEEGVWRVNAAWAGDSDTVGNTSESESFTVNNSKVNVGYAIIIAGRDDYDRAGQAINISANNSYNVLLKRGFTHERIFYLNPCMKHDADLDGEYDVDKISSLNNIEYAINTWAQGNVSGDVPLLIYMVGHGGNDTFIVNGTNDKLTASELNKYLDQITDTTGCCYISIVYDASHSGSFIDNLSRCGRVIVTSVDSDADALYVNKKGVIFSNSFFDNISSGKTIKEAFENASNHFETLNFSDKTPQLDDNGDGNGSTISYGDDGLLAASIYFGSQEGSDESDKNNDVLGERIAGREFTDANGYSYNNGIPTIRLEGV